MNLPDRVLRLVDPAQRKVMGKAGVTTAEGAAKETLRLEREDHAQFLQWLRLHNLPFIHARTDRKSSIQEGWPDFSIFGKDGRVLFVELKLPGKRLDPLQRETGNLLLQNGFPFRVAYSYAEAIAFAKESLSIS